MERVRGRESTSTQWIILICGVFLTFLTLGFVSSLGVMFVDILEEFGSPRSEVAMIQALCYGNVFLSGGFNGALIAKFGPGPFIIAGSILSSLGLFVSAFAGSSAVIIVFTGIVTGIGSSFGFCAAFVAIGHVFNKKNASAAMIFTATGVGIGPFLFPLLLEALIENYAWRGAFIVCSAIQLNSLVPGFIIYFHYSNRKTAKKRTETETMNSMLQVYSDLARDGVFVVLTAMRFCITATLPAEFIFLVDALVTKGFERKDGSILISVIGISNVVGRILAVGIRMVLDWPTVSHWIYVLILTAIAHLLYMLLTDFWSWVAVSVLYGIAFGMLYSQAQAVILEAVGIRKFAIANGIVFAADGIGAIIGGYLGGYINDTTGSYNIWFYTASGVAVCCSVIHGVLLIQMRATNRWEQEWNIVDIEIDPDRPNETVALDNIKEPIVP